MLINNKNIETAYPLSPMQSGFLFQSLYAPDSDAYFVQSIFELDGEIDIAVLKEAWQTISNHHPILRTGFIWEDGAESEQYVLESAVIPFTAEDWQALTEAEQSQKLKSFIEADRQKGFDLAKAPLFRLTIIQCNSNKYYLIWSQHHILMDGWSTPIILGDAFKAYENLRLEQEVQLTSRPPYRDYIAWLQKQDLNKAEIFWKSYFTSLEEPTRLSFNDIIKEKPEKDYQMIGNFFGLGI